MPSDWETKTDSMGINLSLIHISYLFVENFQTADDYANRPFYATFTRWLKYIAFFLAIFLPGLYVGIAAHDPELLPETLLVTIAQAERSTPFPVMLEAILLYFMYELMRDCLLYTSGIAYAALVCGLSVLFPFFIKTELPLFTVLLTVLLGGMGQAVRFLFQAKYRVLLQAEGRGYVLINANLLLDVYKRQAEHSKQQKAEYAKYGG